MTLVRPIHKILLSLQAPFGALNNYALQGGGSTHYLSRTMGAGDTKKWAFSFWVRTSSLAAAGVILGGSATQDIIQIDTSGRISWYVANAVGQQITTAGDLVINTNYHILVHWDSANATAGDRMRVFKDGTELTGFAVDTQPTQNTDSTCFNAAAAARITQNTAAGSPLSSAWVIDELAFFDGQLPTAAELRDSVTGKPRNLSSMTFGPCGWWLRFEGATGTTSGNESSPNGNHWTVNAIADADIVPTVF